MLSKPGSRRRNRSVRRSHGRLLRCELLENRVLLNAAPTLTLSNRPTTLAENTDVTARLKIADIAIGDDGQGTNTLSLTGEDAALFEFDGTTALYLKAGTVLDYETIQQLDVTVNVDDASIGTTVDDSESFSISIVNLNEAPVISVPATGPTVTEGANATGTISGISVADQDAGSNQITVTLGIPSVAGKLSVQTVPGGDATISGNNTHSITLTGTLSQINTALAAAVTYTVPSAEFSGPVTLTVTANDLGRNGLGGAKTDSKSVAIQVVGNNDPPVVTVPGALSLTEDELKAITGISIDDPDAGTADIRVSLYVEHGKLTVPTNVSGGLIANDVTGNNTKSVVLRGTVAEINATLAATSGLTYVGDADYNGSDTLTVTANDLGRSGTGNAQEDTKTVSITLTAFNDVPALTVPGPKTVTPNTDLFIPGISVNDVDAGDAEIQVNLTVINGTLTLRTDVSNGLTAANIQNNNTKVVTLTGSQAKINATLAASDGLKYRGNANYTGTDTLTVDSDDKGNGPSGSTARTDSKTVALSVTDANQAPTLTVPGAQTATEDTDKEISGISIADIDAGTADVELRLQAPNGKLTVRTDVSGGVAAGKVQGNGSSTVTLTGSLTQINATLAASGALKYRGNTDFNGSDTITVTANDKGNTGTGGAKTASKTVAITVSAVNDAPVVTAPTTRTVPPNTDFALTGISVADDATSDIQVTLVAGKGSLTLLTNVSGGLTSTGVAGNGTKSVTLTGTPAKIKATLEASGGLKYRADSNYTGADTLTITANDQGKTGTGGTPLTHSKSVAITVTSENQPPVITVPAAQTAAEETDLSISGISVTDQDAGTGNIIVTLSVTHGKLNIKTDVTGGLVSTNITNNGTKTVTLNGPISKINATLAASGGLKYRGDADYTGADTLTVTANDLGTTLPGGAKTATQTVAITVSEANDAPVVTAPGSQTVPKDTERAITGISIADSDAGSGQIEVTLEVTNGKLKVLTNVSGGVAASGVTGNETSKVVLKGTREQINATLAAANGLKYVPNAGYTGSDTLKVKADDKGNTGAGGAKQDEKSVALVIGSSSLSGYVYVDVNNDGAMVYGNSESVEVGLAGVTVKLRQKSGTSTTYTDLVTVKTGPDGYYQFDNLPAGTYEIVETQPDKFMDGKEMAGNLGGTAEDNRITNIVVKAGDQGRGYDFCERGLKLQYIGMQMFLGSAPSAYQSAAEYAGLKAVTISGTAGNDDIQFIAGADSHKIIVNGKEQVYAATSVDVFTIDAGAGSDKVTLNGTSGTDSGRILPGRSTLRGSNYMVEALYAEDVKIDGKEGDDDGALYDSAGNDALTTAGNKATLTGSNYLAQLIAFDRVRAISQRGGNDTAQQATDFVLMLEGNWK